jgi:hypothetical protein
VGILVSDLGMVRMYASGGHAFEPAERHAVCRECGSQDLLWDLDEDLARRITCNGCHQTWRGEEAPDHIKIVRNGQIEARKEKKEKIMTEQKVEETAGAERRYGGKDGEHQLCAGRNNTCKKQVVKGGFCVACYRHAHGESLYRSKKSDSKKGKTDGVTKDERAALEGAAGTRTPAVKPGVPPVPSGAERHFNENLALATHLREIIHGLPIPEAAEDRAIGKRSIILPAAVINGFDRVTITLERENAAGRSTS